MRYRMSTDGDNVSYLIGRCLRNQQEAERMFEALIRKNMRTIEMFAGTLNLSQAEHDEFVARFSAEVEPTLWEPSGLTH
ncbi:MAG: hypothetical protein RQ723_06795 [Desulfuromonadales bacterium]|nr:hypothetical protein [Desulfuromonadales bacterium]